MKKIVTCLALAGLSLPLMADNQIHLAAGSQLSLTSIEEIQLREGERRDNVWFKVDESQIDGAQERGLSNCVLTARVGLNAGQVQFTSKNLRCPSTATGDVYTAEPLEARLTPSNQFCASSRCTEISLDTSTPYAASLTEAARLQAVYNPSREVNRMRIQEQQRSE